MCFYIVKYFVNVSLDKCVRNPCAKSQMCWTDKDGSATCFCPPGFAGEDCSGKGILMGNVPHPVLLSYYFIEIQSAFFCTSSGSHYTR